MLVSLRVLLRPSLGLIRKGSSNFSELQVFLRIFHATARRRYEFTKMVKCERCGVASLREQVYYIHYLF